MESGDKNGESTEECDVTGIGKGKSDRQTGMRLTE